MAEPLSADPADPADHRGSRAIRRMVEFAPSTGGLALWAGHRDVAADSAAAADAEAPVTTDGRTLFYAAAFERLPIARQTGLVARQVLHIALRHVQRFAGLRQLLGDADLQLFGICAGAIVDSTLAHLGWLELPASAVGIDRLLDEVLEIKSSVDAALLEWDVERLYRAVDDRRSGRDGPRAARVRALGAGRDAGHAGLRPAAGGQPPPEHEAEQSREWAERILRAHTGDGAYSMLRVLLADLPGSRTPWEQVLRTRLARGLSTKPAISWSRPTRSYTANQGRSGPYRRMPWEPGFGGSRTVPRLALVVDVSGSIDDALMGRFAREVTAITRRLEAALLLVVGDDRVRRVARFEPGRADLGGITFGGAGGTDFTPLLEEADRDRPDIGVVLTDLQGPARFRPRWPVIWAVPEAHRRAVPPFGRKLVLG